MNPTAPARRPPLDPASLEGKFQVLLWRVLVEPVPPKTHEGVIELPEQSQEAERILTTVGRVVQLGHFAYQSRTSAGLHLAEEPKKPKVGDYVLFQQYAGQEVHLRSGHLLRLLNDTEILMWTSDPEEIRIYV